MNSRTFTSKPSRTSTKGPAFSVKQQQDQQQKGKIMTLRDLHKAEDAQPQPQPQPQGRQRYPGKKKIHGENNPKTTEPKPKPNKGPGGGMGMGQRHAPMRIGGSNDSNKWKCKICKFMNDNELEVCDRCESEKGEIREEYPEDEGEF